MVAPHAESEIQVETITHQAEDAPDLLMDDAIRELYESIHPDDRTPGVHIMTGPIYIEEASPGDTFGSPVFRSASTIAVRKQCGPTMGLSPS